MKSLLGERAGIILGSHPTGVRGLKFGMDCCLWPTVVSHPTGVRGLKSNIATLPHQRLSCRTPLGCVD